MSIGRLLPARTSLPRDPFVWVKGLLLALVGAQLARLLWALVTPVGTIGQWMPPVAPQLPAAAQTALLTSFDPFNRSAVAVAGAAALARPSEFKLFGTRAGSSGLAGSAIIAGSDGEQVSVSVGEEVVPGVKLVAVGFDQVVLERGGQRIQLAMDAEPSTGGSVPAGAGPAGAGPAGAAMAQTTPAAPAAGGLSAARLKESIALAPRQRGGQVTGLLVSPMGDESVMQAAGLRNGDVIVAVNGRRVASLADATALQAQVTPGARLSLTVERGAATVPVALNLAGT